MENDLGMCEICSDLAELENGVCSECNRYPLEE